MEKKENNYIGKKLISIINQEYLGEIVQNRGIFYVTDSGYHINKKAEGNKWKIIEDSYIGKKIMGIESQEIWGEIVKNEGNIFRLKSGRIAKKITEGKKWKIIQDNYNGNIERNNYNGTIEKNNENFYILNSGIKIKKNNENETWTIENEQKKNGNKIQYIGKKIKELVHIDLWFEQRYEIGNDGSYRSIRVEIEGNSLENIHIKLEESNYDSTAYYYTNNNEYNSNRNERNKYRKKLNTRIDIEEYDTLPKFFDHYYKLLNNENTNYNYPHKIELFMESLIRAYRNKSWNYEMKRYREVKSL